MGNQLAPAAKQGGPLETGELLNVVVKEALGGSRFLKSLLCLHDNGGLVVVKVFYKRKDAGSLVPYKQQLQAIREVLLGLQCPHVWPMQLWWETPNAAYMMRQHFFANLYDRLSTRPFLTVLEKRWITFQLLHALSQAHAHGVCHGDIKCENVMVTSWNWLLLVDFASYKPTYLPADNPADFSYYFDTGSRRRCYLAPERFFEGSAAAMNTAAPLQPDMDIFSLGCVIAELWLDGRAFFDLSRLLAYRRGEYDPTAALAGVEPDMAELIMHMIQRSPGERWSADHYLSSWPRRMFPSHFSDVLHPFFNSLLDLESDARLAAVAKHYEKLAAAIDSSRSSISSGDDGGSLLSEGMQPARSPASHPPTDGLPSITRPQASAPPAAATPAAAAADSSSTAGGSKLLAEVDSLLCDVAAVQRRLGGGAAAVAAEDDGICIDEPESECAADFARGAYRPVSITAQGISPLQQQQQQQQQHRGSDGFQSSPDGTAAPAVGLDASSMADTAGGSRTAGASDAAAAGGVSRDEGMVLLAVLLCTLLRGSKLQESKRVAIMLLFRCGLLCDDEVRLQTIVPYLLTQLADPSAGVRTLALRCAVQLMASLSRLPPADAKVYHDYILPSLSLLPNDLEELVRVGYAIAAAHLAAAAHEQLLALQFDHAAGPGQGLSAAAAGVGVDRQRIQQSNANQSGSSTPTGAAAAAAAGDVVDTNAAQQQQQRQSDSDSSTAAATRQALQQQQQQQHSIRYDAEMAAMRVSLDKAVCDVLTDSRSTADIKRALLSHAHQLGVFFGRRDINNVLLPLLLTVLNAVEWQLRGSFFGAVAALGPHTGKDSLDVFLLPVLEQALVDSEVAVVCAAVSSLATLCHQLRKRSLLKAADKVAPLLQHSSAAVRHSAVACIAAIARVLPPVDVYAQLAVMVADRVQQQPLMLTDEEHLAACLHPTSDQQQQQQPSLQAQYSVTTSFKLHQQQQQQQQSGPVGSLLNHRVPGSSRTSADDLAAGLGSLVTRPAAAAVRHSSSDRLLGSGVTGPGISLSRNISSPRSLIDSSELNLEGSSLTLNPVAPIYCLDIDQAMLGNTAVAVGSSAAAGIGSSSAAAGNFRNRWGYRSEGFSATADSSSSSSRARSAAQSSPQNASVGPGLVPPGSKDLATAAAAAAAGPGRFWPGPSAGISAYVSNNCSSSGGLLTGLSPGLGVGPGGLVLGSSCVGIGAGLRPRPKSSHTAAVESISRKQAVLQERYESLCEALARDPSGLEASDRQQMERLAATLHRLKLQPGSDVRCAAALLTYKMAAVTSRAGPGGVPGNAGDNSAPAVYDAVSAAISTGIGQHLPGPGLEGMAGAGGPSWRPRGVLASHLQEHRAAVNCLATSANGAILLSASDDETVKVWDIRRLERDVTFASRLTYAGQSGRITGLCPVLDGSSVASGSSSGSLHVWRVDYSSKPGGWAPDKYRGITAVRQLSPGEGSILQVTPWGGHPALLLYASQRGGVHCCDLRCAADVWHVPAAPSLGLAQQLVADPSGQHWLAQGTSRGWVCLWDVRFLLCVNSWQHPQRSGIDAMSLAVAAPPRLGLQQGSLPHPGVPLLYMSAGLQEVGLWDVLDGKCHQVLRALNRQESQLSNFDTPAALQPPLPAAAGPIPNNLNSIPSSRSSTSAAAATPFALGSQFGGAPGAGGLQGGLDVTNVASELSTHLAIDQINSPQTRLGGVTALLPLPGGALLAGGADRCVRYWDGSWPERSYIVTGPVWPDDTGIMDPQTNKLQVPAHVHRYSKRMYSGVPVLEERCVGDATRQVMPDSSPDLGSKLRMHELVHADSITQLLAVDGASKLLVSASRDGCIKVWK